MSYWNSMAERGEPSYRANQIYQSLYRQRVSELDAISTLPQSLRVHLARQYSIGQPKVEQKFQSVDGTVRYLMQLADGETIETVWMPEGDGGEAGDGSDAAMESEGADHSWSRGNDLRIESGGLCGGLQVLPHGFAQGAAKSHCRRNHRTSLCGTQRSRRQSSE
jgi:hypothetical protein